MDKRRFWELIDDARRQAGDQLAVVLVDQLAGLAVGDIMRWQNIFAAYQRLSYKNKLWAAAYVINGGCSDDGFDYFRGWLTAQGKDVFLRALADPDSLVAVDVEMDEAFDEDMLAVGYSAFFKTMGMVERDYARAQAAYRQHALSDGDLQDLAADIRYAPDIDLKWNEGGLEAVLPKLCAKFN